MSRKSEIMSKEILFRGKRFDNGEWVEGLPYKAKYGGISAIVNENEERFVIIPETLRRYIGLTDKNGKRIFEQDIVIIEYSTTKVKGYIEYQGVAFYVATNSDLWDINEFVSIEVIGNVTDNPELLEVDE